MARRRKRILAVIAEQLSFVVDQVSSDWRALLWVGLLVAVAAFAIFLPRL